jgi:hypothetical protein
MRSLVLGGALLPFVDTTRHLLPKRNMIVVVSLRMLNAAPAIARLQS